MAETVQGEVRRTCKESVRNSPRRTLLWYHVATRMFPAYLHPIPLVIQLGSIADLRKFRHSDQYVMIKIPFVDSR